MQLDSTLNIVWLVLGFLAVGFTFGVSSRKTGSKSWRLAGIVLVVAALFPFISATDDILRVEHFTTQNESQHRGGHGKSHSQRTTNGDDLIRLYEALDAPLAPPIHPFSVVLLFVFFIAAFSEAVLSRVAPRAAGRSPPGQLLATF